MFGISLRALVGLLAVSKTSFSLTRTTSSLSAGADSTNGERDPASTPDGWDNLLNTKICSALEKQDLFHAHYAAMGNPSWKLDLQPSGACILEFTDEAEKTVAKYDCRLVGSESNTAGTFMWAIPPDPTMGVPHSLLDSSSATPDIQSSIFQTKQEIPMSPTVNGYSIALIAGALLEEPAKAVFLGPYGDETGTLYLLITDEETYPKIKDDRPKLDRLKGFGTMVAEIPFITNHRAAFTAYANDLGLNVVSDDDDKVVVTDDVENDSLDAQFDSEGNMKRLGELMLMTTEELEHAKFAQAENLKRKQEQQTQTTQAAQDPPSPGGDPNNKCAKLQINFFQKVMDESVPDQRKLFLDVAVALELKLSENASTAAEVTAWDPEKEEAAVGVFDADNRMTQWRNEKKTA